MTLLELLMASVLLAIAAVPIITGIMRALDLTRELETRNRATMLAQHEMEAALATAALDFNQYLGKDSEDLGDGYRVTIQGVLSGYRKTFTVEVGRDTNGNSHLDDEEVLVAFATRVADVTSSGE